MSISLGREHVKASKLDILLTVLQQACQARSSRYWCHPLFSFHSSEVKNGFGRGCLGILAFCRNGLGEWLLLCLEQQGENYLAR